MRALRNLLLPASLLITGTALASDGDMDTTFGGDLGAGGGQFLSDINIGWNWESAKAILPVANDGYVLVGNVDGMIGLMQIDQRGTVVRRQETNVTGTPINAVRDASGRILTLWYSKIVRFNSDFSLDTTYGDSGIATIPNMPGYESPYFEAIALDHSGRIVVAGNAAQFGTTNQDMAVARLLSNGSLDASFGSSGQTAIAFDLITNGQDSASNIAIAADDSVALAGEAQNTGLDANGDFFSYLAVARLQTDGALDLSFNGNGKRTIDLGTAVECCGSDAVAFDESDRIVIAGFTPSSGLVTRLLANGQNDAKFHGTNPASPSGMALTSLGPRALAISSDGHILIAGASAGVCSKSTMTVERLTSSGTEDLSFDGGSSVRSVGFDECATTAKVGSSASAMLLDAARPVLFGLFYNGDNTQGLLAVARLQSDLIFANRFGD